AQAHLRCLGLRALPVGYRLDARLRGRELRERSPAVRRNQAPERKRARDADGRRLRQSLRLVPQEVLGLRCRRPADLGSPTKTGLNNQAVERGDDKNIETPYAVVAMDNG